ncbi:23S rRNA (adenine(2030)-N(6))-methyltransferase RlmJ [Roseibacterium beibuensis]|uniref:23S rRNA (adenine(2030)-N(6))-methyltransferase RlmJ n=1 Tax=[Roseibacterium] beibuensis TaxID=1193142 RepID=UPI00217D33EB|nr:23S rRNA (adenine(2030)-N(6))-methyltransferase RlmJ [Roseibacterium beibuensis]MCS6627242.1 23S rRNA (adenine(2030)-N(6))-methyltransferase RlmJ [Roseibacterium beibuensis]
MNYRHSFHAGNFADLVKHALVLWLLGRRQGAGPVTVIDTHAGAGVYDLTGDGARSKEAEAGVARLMAAADRPPLIEALAAEVARLNPHGGAALYPGSPLLIAGRLRPTDRYVGFELNPPVLDLLEQALEPFPQAVGMGGDGYDQARGWASRAQGAFVLIDPPFERPDDYNRAADAAAAIALADPRAIVAVWTPLKDLETFDGFLRRLDKAGVKRALVAEARLRPLTNPMKMNGCAVVVLNPPAGAEAAASEICGWVADRLGDAGARSEVWMTGAAA